MRDRLMENDHSESKWKEVTLGSLFLREYFIVKNGFEGLFFLHFICIELHTVCRQDTGNKDNIIKWYDKEKKRRMKYLDSCIKMILEKTWSLYTYIKNFLIVFLPS